jgi:hypothetical protein
VFTKNIVPQRQNRTLRAKKYEKMSCPQIVLGKFLIAFEISQLANIAPKIRQMYLCDFPADAHLPEL